MVRLLRDGHRASERPHSRPHVRQQHLRLGRGDHGLHARAGGGLPRRRPVLRVLAQPAPARHAADRGRARDASRRAVRQCRARRDLRPRRRSALRLARRVRAAVLRADGDLAARCRPMRSACSSPSLHASGRSAGSLYFVSTFGSAAGTLVTSFYLVLLFEVEPDPAGPDGRFGRAGARRRRVRGQARDEARARDRRCLAGLVGARDAATAVARDRAPRRALALPQHHRLRGRRRPLHEVRPPGGGTADLPVARGPRPAGVRLHADDDGGAVPQSVAAAHPDHRPGRRHAAAHAAEDPSRRADRRGRGGPGRGAGRAPSTSGSCPARRPPCSRRTGGCSSSGWASRGRGTISSCSTPSTTSTFPSTC